MNESSRFKKDLCFARKCAGGDERSWRKLQERYRDDLLSVLRREIRRRTARTPAEPELHDLWQDVTVALLENDCSLLRKYDGRVPLRAYLRIITVHRGLNSLIRKGWKYAPLDRLLSVLEKDPADTRRAALQERLEEALHRLSPRERLMIRFRYLEEFSYHEISEVMGVPENSIGRILSEAKETLRKALENHQQGQ